MGRRGQQAMQPHARDRSARGRRLHDARQGREQRRETQRRAGLGLTWRLAGDGEVGAEQRRVAGVQARIQGLPPLEQ
jgi:hypothetical protein